MLHRLSLLSIGFALAMSPLALAQVSVWTDENGQRIYVDSPSTPDSPSAPPTSGSALPTTGTPSTPQTPSPQAPTTVPLPATHTPNSVSTPGVPGATGNTQGGSDSPDELRERLARDE